MNTAPITQQVPSLVRRARAGDENAMAVIARIGQEARKGGERAKVAFVAVQKYIEGNPAQPFQLGTEAAVVMETPKPAEVKRDPELDKPKLPRGIFEGLFDPDSFALVVLRACQYRHGLSATAVVLASGPMLTNPVIHEMGLSNFGSQESSALFFHGVQNPDEKTWMQVAPYLDGTARRCLAIGQCVGRARRIQAVRMPRSRIGAYSEVAGWELGE